MTPPEAIYTRVVCLSYGKASTALVSLSCGEITITDYLFYQAGWKFWVLEEWGGGHCVISNTTLTVVHNAID